MRTLVFIPAWNEEASVASVIADVRECLPEADLLVIDDGSTDATVARSREAGALVASLPFNQGLGAALQTGYLYALREGYESCAHLDADGQHPPEEVARLLVEVEAGRADLVIGSRYRDPGAAVASDDYKPTFSRRLGANVFRFFLTLATRQRFTDTTSGMRAANRRVMALFSEHYSPDFAEIESLQLAVREGLRVEEVPVKMLERAGGSSFLIAAALGLLHLQGDDRAAGRPVPPAPRRGRAVSGDERVTSRICRRVAGTLRSTSPRRPGSSPRSWRSPSCC